ncbi:MAG: IS1380 family transposase [Nitrospiraceae bacterium]|nr:IS1380 family transposase [Nitrospiraceae bacterium]
MKSSKAEISSRVHRIPKLRFEDQQLTSFAGLVIIQQLFSKLELKKRLRTCFDHLDASPVFGHHIIVLILVVHLMLGHRRLRDMDYYRDDLMALRLLGLKKLPDVSTVSRALARVDDKSILKLRQACREMLLARIQALGLVRVTLDFDGSVLRTGRMAEGAAVGFNKQKKGQRSYYPLFCTIAQTGQVFDVLPRSGNVHDSNGALEFILECIRIIRAVRPGIIIEVRMDSAFFSDKIVKALDAKGIEFTISVPFERFAELKGIIQGRRRWRCFNGELSYFNAQWKPKKWDSRFRFLFIRHKVKILSKDPVQLDMFIPHEQGYEFKVIVTNKQTTMKKVLCFHNGRGSQENTFSELKSQCNMDYVAVRRLHGNHLYMMSAILAHNLFRELHMQVHEKNRGTTEKRAALWQFTEANTLRRTLLQRAGRLTSPGGILTLTMSANPAVQKGVLHYIERLKQAA